MAFSFENMKSSLFRMFIYSYKDHMPKLNPSFFFKRKGFVL